MLSKCQCISSVGIAVTGTVACNSASIKVLPVADDESCEIKVNGSKLGTVTTLNVGATLVRIEVKSPDASNSQVCHVCHRCKLLAPQARFVFYYWYIVFVLQCFSCYFSCGGTLIGMSAGCSVVHLLTGVGNVCGGIISSMPISCHFQIVMYSTLGHVSVSCKECCIMYLTLIFYLYC